MKSHEHEMSRQRSSIPGIAAILVFLLGNFSLVTSAVAQFRTEPGLTCTGNFSWYNRDCGRQCVHKRWWEESKANKTCDPRFNCQTYDYGAGACGNFDPTPGYPVAPGVVYQAVLHVYDCDNKPTPLWLTSSGVGDGTCDNGRNGRPNFTCKEFQGDDGDCPGSVPDYAVPGQFCGRNRGGVWVYNCARTCVPHDRYVGNCPSPAPKVVAPNVGNACRWNSRVDAGRYDCAGNCADKSLIGNGTCDNGGNNGPDFDCPNLGHDGGDCRR